MEDVIPLLQLLGTLKVDGMSAGSTDESTVVRFTAIFLQYVGLTVPLLLAFFWPDTKEQELGDIRAICIIGPKTDSQAS